MEIAAADAYSVYLEQNVVFPDAGNGNFAKFYRVRFFCVVDQTDHKDYCA